MFSIPIIQVILATLLFKIRGNHIRLVLFRYAKRISSIGQSEVKQVIKLV